MRWSLLIVLFALVFPLTVLMSCDDCDVYPVYQPVDALCKATVLYTQKGEVTDSEQLAQPAPNEVKSSFGTPAHQPTCVIGCLKERKDDDANCINSGDYCINEGCEKPGTYWTQIDTDRGSGIKDCGQCGAPCSFPEGHTTYCELPYYSPEQYPKRCLASVDNDFDGEPDLIVNQGDGGQADQLRVYNLDAPTGELPDSPTGAVTLSGMATVGEATETLDCSPASFADKSRWELYCRTSDPLRFMSCVTSLGYCPNLASYQNQAVYNWQLNYLSDQFWRQCINSPNKPPKDPFACVETIESTANCGKAQEKDLKDWETFCRTNSVKGLANCLSAYGYCPSTVDQGFQPAYYGNNNNNINLQFWRRCISENLNAPVSNPDKCAPKISDSCNPPSGESWKEYAKYCRTDHPNELTSCLQTLNYCPETPQNIASYRGEDYRPVFKVQKDQENSRNWNKCLAGGSPAIYAGPSCEKGVSRTYETGKFCDAERATEAVEDRNVWLEYCSEFILSHPGYTVDETRNTFAMCLHHFGYCTGQSVPIGVTLDQYNQQTEAFWQTCVKSTSTPPKVPPHGECETKGNPITARSKNNHGARCCGNYEDGKEDAGRIINNPSVGQDVKLCSHSTFNQGVEDVIEGWQWLDASAQAFKIFTQDRGDRTNYYDTISNGEKWFVCPPKNVNALAAQPGENQINYFSSLPLPATTSSATGAVSLTGFAVSDVPGVEDGDIPIDRGDHQPNDLDGDGYLSDAEKDRDCDDEDPYVYPGAPDPCGEKDKACDDVDASGEHCESASCNTKCAQQPLPTSVGAKTKAARFLCYNEDNKGAFAECCNGIGCTNTIAKARPTGAALVTIKEFSQGCDIDKNCHQEITYKAIGEESTEYAIFTDNPGADVKNKAEAIIKDWSAYTHLELDVKFTNSYIFDISFLGNKIQEGPTVLQSYTILKTLSVKDYTTTSPATGKWLHVKIPLSVIDKAFLNNIEGIVLHADMEKMQKFGRAFKYKEENVYNVIRVDRIYLSGADDFFCSGALGKDWASLWIKDLDDLRKDTRMEEAGKLACQSFKSFDWAGSKTGEGQACCGDDTSSNNPEYFAGVQAGCFAGTPVGENTRIGALRLDFGDSNRGEASKFYQCSKEECEYPLRGLDSRSSSVSNPYPELYKAHFVETGAINSNTITKQKSSPSTELAQLRVENIPRQILFSNEDFHGCDIDYSKDVFPGDISSDLIKPAEFCDVRGSYVCSYPTPTQPVGEWNGDEAAGLPATSRSAQRGVPTEERNLFFQVNEEAFRDDGCCPDTYCWDGIKCVLGVPQEKELSESTYNQGNFKEAFTNDFGFERPEKEFDQFVCKQKVTEQSQDIKEVKIVAKDDGVVFEPEKLNLKIGESIKWSTTITRDNTLKSDSRLFEDKIIKDGNSFTFKFSSPGTFKFTLNQDKKLTVQVSSEGVDSSWKKSYYKGKYDGSSYGYCIEDNKCWSGDRCVSTGFYEKDNYCEEGKWTSRTKVVAKALSGVVEGEDYSIFCDEPQRALNKIDGELADALLKNGEATNNFCVVRYGSNVMIGTSLNEPVISAEGSLKKFTDLVGVPCAGASENSEIYEACDPGRKLWFNGKDKIVLFSKYGENVPNDERSFFQQFVENPIQAIVNLFLDLFKPPRLDDPDVDRLLKRVGKLKRLFIGANGERKVLGFMEELGNTGKQLMDVEFRGFKADLCEAYYAKSDVSSKVKCEPIVKGNEFYYSLKSVNENFGETELSHWQDATAKLRIANTALVDSGSGIAPVVVKPVNDQSLDKNEGLKLEAREDSNARTYYYDLDVRKDDNGEDVFNGEIFGRDVRLDVISEHYDIPEGYHKIGLIEIGKNGMPYTATVDICINSEKDTDNDGQNDGCDKDDDNDGVPDSGDGDYFVGNKPCRGSSSGCDDNCPTVANSDQADSDGDGVGDACSQDRDNDGFFNHEDAFPDDPAASKNCDDAEEAEGAKKPDKWNPRATPDQIAASGLTIDDDDDNDGLLDTLEPLGCECDKDCDGDGMGDFEEVSLGRNPASVDSDGDGLRDDEEAAFGANPTLVDTDGDTLGDYREVKELGTKPDTPDSDSDGMDDGYEVEYGLDPNVNDASGDKDNDGLSNLEEKRVGSYPNDPDSDNDRICDGNKEVLGVCAAGPDQTPIKADAPEIVSTVPEQGANVVFQNKIELETKGDATCKLSLTREVFYEDFTKDFVSTGNKHVYDDLIKDGGINPVPLIKSGSNTIYIMCRGAADMEQPFELVFTNDRDPLSVSETSPDKADSFDDIEIKFKTSRTADCKLATSEEGLDSGVSATTSDGFTHTGKVSIVPEAKKLLSDCQNAVTETVVDEDGNTLDSAEFAQGRAGYYYGCRSFMGDGSCDSRPEPIKSICKDVKKYSEATLAGDAELCKDFSQEGLLEVCKYVTSNVNPEDSFCSDDVDCKVLLKLGNALKNSDRQLCESFDEANTFGTDFLAKAVCKARLDNNINYCTSHGCNFVYENRYQVFGQCKDRTTESFLRAPFEVAFPVDKEASPDPLR